MESKINYSAVGSFVIILLAAIILSIMWLSSGLSVEKFNVYRLSMQESVSGLSMDAPVEFNGVNVGTVNSIEVDALQPKVVIVSLKVKSTTPITLGTTATLTTRGLTGTAFISLTDKGLNLKALVPTKKDPMPLITTTPSLFMRLDTALRDITSNLKLISASVHSFLSSDNVQTMRDTMDNLRDITQSFAANTKNFNEIFANAAKASQAFPSLLHNSANALQQFDTSLMPSAQQAISDLGSAAENVTDLSNSIKSDPAMLIRGKTPRQLGPGE